MKPLLSALKTKALPHITRSSKVWEAGRMLMDKNLSCCPVLENSRAVGLIFQRDVYLASVLSGGLSLEVEDILEPRFLKLRDTSTFDEALGCFISSDSQWAIVEDEIGEFQNIISISELLIAAIAAKEGIS